MFMRRNVKKSHKKLMDVTNSDRRMSLRSAAKRWMKEENIEDIPWLIHNYDKVSENEISNILTSKPCCESFCKLLIQEMDKRDQSSYFQVKTLELVCFLFGVLGHRAPLLSRTLMLEGMFDRIASAMKAFPTESSVQQNSLKVLCTLLKEAIPNPNHYSKEVVQAVVKAMTTFPNEEDIVTSGCVVLYRYCKNGPQRMKTVIAADGLEVLAAACDAFPDSTLKIHRPVKVMLQHMIVSLYDALETTNSIKEIEAAFLSE